MKTTDYNTSKKLKELGFETDTNYYYFNKGYLLDYCNNLDEIEYSKPITKAYDLETILDALPKEGFCIDYGIHGKQCLIMLAQFTVVQQKNESLATTAGRLLVKLIEENLIKLEG